MSRIERMRVDVEIAMSIPGIAFTSASSILAEIGNYRDFANGNKLAAWCGLVHDIWISRKDYHGQHNKTGIKHVRRMLVQSHTPYPN